MTITLNMINGPILWIDPNFIKNYFRNDNITHLRFKTGGTFHVKETPEVISRLINISKGLSK